MSKDKEQINNNKKSEIDLGYEELDYGYGNEVIPPRDPSEPRPQRRGATAGASKYTVDSKKRELEQDAAADEIAEILDGTKISEKPSKRRKTEPMDVDKTAKHETENKSWQKKEDDRTPPDGSRSIF
jgi:hypothetical protein